jgi:hypothetical protein
MGAAVGYMPQGDKLVIVLGDPLCNTSQFFDTIAVFLSFV